MILRINMICAHELLIPCRKLLSLPVNWLMSESVKVISFCCTWGICQIKCKSFFNCIRIFHLCPSHHLWSRALSRSRDLSESNDEPSRSRDLSEGRSFQDQRIFEKGWIWRSRDLSESNDGPSRSRDLSEGRSFQDQGIFQKGGVFKIKGSLRRDQMMNLQDQGIFRKGGIFKMCSVCMFYVGLHQPRFYLVDSWAEWLTTCAGEKLGKMQCSESAELLIFDLTIFKIALESLPAFADKFRIAGGFVNTMNLPGCNWGCSSLVRHSRQIREDPKVEMLCWLLTDIIIKEMHF